METEATKPAVFSLVRAGDGCEAGMGGMRLLAQTLEARRPGLHKPTGCIKTESCGCLQETSLEDAETGHLNPPPALNQRPFEVQAYSVSCCHKTVLGALFWRVFLKYSGRQCLLSRPGKRGLYSLCGPLFIQGMGSHLSLLAFPTLFQNVRHTQETRGQLRVRKLPSRGSSVLCL